MKVMSTNLRWLAAFLTAFGTASCAAPFVTRGADLYSRGHYIEAAEVFERTEPRLDKSSPDDRARYGLYRGATLLALGDSQRAQHWLHYSQELSRADQDSLSADDRLQLDQALRTLEKQRPSALPLSKGATLATRHPLPQETSTNNEDEPSLH